MYTLHVHKPSVLPIAGGSLFLDFEVVTLLLKEFTMFALENLYYPTGLFVTATSLDFNATKISRSFVKIPNSNDSCNTFLAYILNEITRLFFIQHTLTHNGHW